MPLPERATVLAIDTAASGCSVALWSGKLLAERVETMPRGQSERLLPMIESLLADVGLEYGDLDGIAVTIGPGAFTGLRIGLAAAKGLGLALDLPLIGVNSFDAVAARVPAEVRRKQNLAVFLESKRSDFYFQLTAPSGEDLPEEDLPGEVLCGPLCIDGEDLVACIEGHQPVLLAGDGKERAVRFLDGVSGIVLYQGDDRVRAAEVAKIAASRGHGESSNLSPLYLRPPDVTLSKAKN